MGKYNFSIKFYFGILLILLSFIIGKITTATFIIYYNDQLWKWTSLIIYIASWPMLIIGIWWIGNEYATMLKKYISYKFYHESAKKGAKKVIDTTKSKSKAIGKKVAPKISKVKSLVKRKKIVA